MGTKFAVGDGRARGPKPKSAEDKLAALDLSGADSCEQGHPFTAENTYIVDGRWGVWRQCRKCQSENVRTIRARCVFAMRWYKDRPCMDCGERLPTECMDFDHVRGVKKYTLASATNLSLPVLWAEVQKCDVVCANCHRIRTTLRRK